VRLVHVPAFQSTPNKFAGPPPPRLSVVRRPESTPSPLELTVAFAVRFWSSWCNFRDEWSTPAPCSRCAATRRCAAAASRIAAGLTPPPALALHQGRRIPNRRSGSFRRRVKPTRAGQPAGPHPLANLSRRILIQRIRFAPRFNRTLLQRKPRASSNLQPGPSTLRFSRN
jgi:hypothetical protein